MQGVSGAPGVNKRNYALREEPRQGPSGTTASQQDDPLIAWPEGVLPERKTQHQIPQALALITIKPEP